MNGSLASLTADLLRLLVRLVTLLIEAVAWWLAREKGNPDKAP